MLHVRDLTARFDPAQPLVLAGVSFDVAPGTVLGVIGPNGSGKSTLARVIAGVIGEERGHVTWGASGDPRVGLVVQDPAAQSIAPTVADDVAYGPEAAGVGPDDVAARVGTLLDQFELRVVAASDPQQLSGGQQQRGAVAAVLACDVDVLILDEPTSLLDPIARRTFPQIVREHVQTTGAVALWMTQELDELAICDQVLVLDAGAAVWHGSTAAFVADPSIAATWELPLPGASRIAHEIRRAGDWPPGVPIPVSEADLVGALAGGGGVGGT